MATSKTTLLNKCHHSDTNQDIKKAIDLQQITKVPLKHFNSKKNVIELYTRLFKILRPTLVCQLKTLRPAGDYSIFDLLIMRFAEIQTFKDLIHMLLKSLLIDLLLS